MAQELAGQAHAWLGGWPSALEALQPAPDAWGELFVEAAHGGLRDDLSCNLERERQAREQAERVRQLQLMKKREAHVIRDNELEHGL